MTREITIVTPEHVELKFELAGLGSRFIATFVDTMLQALISILMFAVLIALLPGGYGLFGTINWFGNLSGWIVAAFILVQFVLWTGYFLFFEAARNGQTPGKKSAGIRVIRDTGHPVDCRSAVLRTAMRFVDALPGFYGVGMISIFVSSEYRRLGDYVAGTLVVKTASQTKPAPDQKPAWSTVATEQTEESLLPDSAMPNLHNITREDYRALRHFLDRRRELDDAVTRNIAAQMAAPLAIKLRIPASEIEDPVLFLENLGRVWERRMVH